MSLGSVPLRSPPLAAWDAPGLCDHQRPPLLAPFAPVSARPVRAWRRTATGCGHGVRGILSLATVCSHGQVQSKDAHAGLPNSKSEMRNQAPARPAHCPSGLFPLGEKVGQLCSGLKWTFGTVGVRLALCPLPLHISSWPWQGPEVCLEPAVGQLVRMAPEAPVALQSGCQALKFPVDHNSN